MTYGMPGRGAGEALDLPARSRFGEGRAETLEVVV
jgi:hypothetical protein